MLDDGGGDADDAIAELLDTTLDDSAPDDDEPAEETMALLEDTADDESIVDDDWPPLDDAPATPPLELAV